MKDQSFQRKEQLKALMTDDGWQIKPCSDGGCVLGHPGGMHTNGGCQHLKGERGDMRRTLHAAGRRIDELRKENERLRVALEGIANDGCAADCRTRYNHGLRTPRECNCSRSTAREALKGPAK